MISSMQDYPGEMDLAQTVRASYDTSREESTMPQPEQSTWLDPKALVSIYAALVATGALLWNIFRSINENKRKVVLDYHFTQAWIQQGVLESPVYANLSLRIRNHSKKSVYINRPTFVLRREINTNLGPSKRFENPVKGTFPKELKPGEQEKIDYRIKPIVDMIGDQLKPRDSVFVEISDTFDNVYESNRKRYQLFKNQVKLANDLNSKGK